MIYFYNNLDLTVDWQHAYQQLNFKYQQLSLDHTKAIQLRSFLQQKIQTIIKENQEIKLKKQQKDFPNPQKDSVSFVPSLLPSEKEITIRPLKKTTSNIKKQSSGQTQTKLDPQNYECTYDGCGKVYSSPVSMNLHIKMKHNGGTKKQRQAYARILLQAQQRGDDPPALDINLPPKFLQEYRTSYDYMKKYSM